MALKKFEVAINKSTSVELDPDTIAIVSLMYHTADKKTNPTDKSWYRTEVRVAKKADLQEEIKQMSDFDNRLKTWHWPNPTWDPNWFMGYDKANDNSKGAKFLKQKLRKATDWQRYADLVENGIKTLSNGQQKRYWGAEYDHEGFTDIDGNQNLSILDRQTLLDHLNKPLWKIHPLKRETKVN